MRIFSGIQKTPQKIIIYGTEGIGKTTMAAQFPNALFIDTEESTKFLDVRRTEAPQSFQEILAQIDYVRRHPDLCDTLIVDTLDWAEELCLIEILRENKWSSIETPGWGRGYTLLEERFVQLFDALTRLTRAGVNVVGVAHAQVKRTELPDELGSYDRYTMKLRRRCETYAKEWADAVLFMNLKTVIADRDREGRGKARAGKRMIYTQRNPARDAKNRWGLPDEIPADIQYILPHLYKRGQSEERSAGAGSFVPPAHTAAAPSDARQKLQEAAQRVQMNKMTENMPETINAPQERTQPQAAPSPIKEFTAPVKEDFIESNPAIYSWEDREDLRKLDLLMKTSGVAREELEQAVINRGWYPAGSTLESFSTDFVNGTLIPHWNRSVLPYILTQRTEKEN